jgi:catechol 2,3-dioxygenase-like lactoylglutathione lyase family enzyme
MLCLEKLWLFSRNELCFLKRTSRLNGVSEPASKTASQVHGVVETCINVAEIHRAREFYESVLSLEAMVCDDRFCAFRVGKDVLLLFVRGGSDRPVLLSGGMVPPHETVGAGHVAFAVSSDTLPDWRMRLHERGIEIESEVRWERGGASIYFRDPDNNLLELATPGVWANY